jgi:hypothetical protein
VEQVVIDGYVITKEMLLLGTRLWCINIPLGHLCNVSGDEFFGEAAHENA